MTEHVVMLITVLVNAIPAITVSSGLDNCPLLSPLAAGLFRSSRPEWQRSTVGPPLDLGFPSVHRVSSGWDRKLPQAVDKRSGVLQLTS